MEVILTGEHRGKIFVGCRLYVLADNSLDGKTSNGIKKKNEV